MFVAMLDKEGYPDTRGALKKVADFAGIHTNVLRRWWKKTQNPPPTKLVTQKKADIDQRLNEVIHAIIDVLPDAIEEASARDLFTGLGIAIDKLLVMTGKPNERVEHTVNHVERVERLTALFDAARERRSVSPDHDGESGMVIH